MNPEQERKLESLKNILKATEGCAVAFSGGVDSSVVLAAAYDVLGERCLAVIATSSTYPEREYKRAVEWVKEQNIPHVVISSEELDIPEFSCNPTNRCYHCKKELFVKVGEQAHEHGIKWVADGSNADDTGDFRPGMMAAKELKVLSPLKEAGMTKEDIRAVARDIYKLPVADKPSMACLASRFPYGNEITGEKLGQVEQIEEFLEGEGFRVFRARHHDDTVRIELGPEEMKMIADDGVRQKVTEVAKTAGFTYVTIDIEGYRTGSMNETLTESEKVIEKEEK
ncbi:ATP-dependent sacrificial sulfur transferase LarE [Candidatus Latescibacterota bacterium]